MAFKPTAPVNQSLPDTSGIANQPPEAKVGQDKTVNENTPVILVGDALDPNPDDKISYSWVQTSGHPVILNGSNTTNPTFITPSVSSTTKLMFSLVATDDKGAVSKPAIVTIIVRPINDPPIANAGEDKTVDAGNVVSLDGTGSKDPDGDFIRYSWIQTQTGSPIIKLNAADTAMPSFIAPPNITSDTDLTFRLTVKDDKNISSTDDAMVTINHIIAGNKSPVAYAGTDQTVNANSMVYLDSSKSKDPDGDKIISYSWKQISGPAVTLNNSNTANPSFKAPNVSTDTDLKFSLMVKDDKKSTGNPVFVTITVKHINHNPTANAEKNQTVTPGYVVSLDGTGSKDPDGDPLSYSWVQVDGPSVKIDDSKTAVATFTAPKDISSDTDMIFELTVRDSKNATSKDSVKVTVKYIPPPNQPPVANAGPDQTVNSGDTVTLDGSGSTDSDGKIVSYSWKQISGPIITLNNANSVKSTFTAPTVSSDTELKFILTVTDDKGSITNPSIVTVTVTVKASEQPSLPTTSSAANETIFNNETSSTSIPSDQTQLESTTEYSFVKKWGSKGTGNGQFDNPHGIATDSSGNVYVVDFNLNNHRIQKFDSNGNFIIKWGSSGSGDGQFILPGDIGTDSAGNVYVVDSGNNRIQKFDSNGNFITKWGSEGGGDGQFDGPQGVAIDSSGNVYVTDFDNHRIQKFDSNGNFITKWGSDGDGDGQFNSPEGVATDSSGNVYVVDKANYRIQKFDSNGNFITKWGPEGTGDGQFYSLYGVATDSSGNVYVTDSFNHRIQKFDSNGNFITKWGSEGGGDGQFNSREDVATDSSGNVYVADGGNSRIQKFAPSRN